MGRGHFSRWKETKWQTDTGMNTEPNIKHTKFMKMACINFTTYEAKLTVKLLNDNSYNTAREEIIILEGNGKSEMIRALDLLHK